MNSLAIGDDVEISLALSRENIQSRFVGKFTEISYHYTPNHTIQGFVVNKMCEFDETTFLSEDQGIVFKNNHLWLFIDNDTTFAMNDSIVSTRVQIELNHRIKMTVIIFSRLNTIWSLAHLMLCQ